MTATMTITITPKVKVYLMIASGILSTTSLIGFTTTFTTILQKHTNEQCNSTILPTCKITRCQERAEITCGDDAINMTAAELREFTEVACWSYQNEIPCSVKKPDKNDILFSLDECRDICLYSA